ncbi:MAG: glycosyltransferase family 4 protein [Desulfovibrio sp.]|nr:glycosyltransferase family 4 protein [Desulfovibrio sp.]
MSKSVFLSLHPFFEEGPINGRKKANAFFMSALLDLDPFDSYHFFVDNPSGLEQLWKKYSHLHALRRDALRAFTRRDLLSSLASIQYTVCHLSDPIDDYVNVAVARNRFSSSLFPLTAPNHTLSYCRYGTSFQNYIWDGWGPCDLLGCNSRAALSVVRQYFSLLNDRGYNLPKLEVLHMGSVLPVQDGMVERRRAIRSKLKINEDAILLFFLGRLSSVDKMDPLPLLLALCRAQEMSPNLEMTLVVSGASSDDEDPLFSVLPLLAKRLNLDVRLIPNPDESDKDALFCASDIFVSPSDNIQETFGLTLVEAFAYSLPVIASDWDGYKDIVEHNVTGILVPTITPFDTPVLDTQSMFMFDNHYHFLRGQMTCIDIPAFSNAIALLASDPLLRQRMGKAGRERVVKYFSWQAAVERWCSMWSKLINTQIAASTQSRMRFAQHPLFLPFGRIFSQFSTGHLSDDDYLSLSSLGEMLLRGTFPWQSFDIFRFGFSEENLRPLLVYARNGVSFAALRKKCSLDSELFERYVLWCLKHDLLERSSQ